MPRFLLRAVLPHSMIIVFLIFVICCEQKFAAAQDDCQPTSCHVSGPVIRFPFRLKGRQPEHCGYPGFDLSCNPINTNTEFEFQFPVRASTRKIVLPVSVKATVQQIDYRIQSIWVRILNSSCLPNRIPDFNASASPFDMYGQVFDDSNGVTLLNCSGRPNIRYGPVRVACMDRGGYQVYAIGSYYSISELSPLSNCVKMYNVSYGASSTFNVPMDSWENAQLGWPDPSCGNCEAKGMYCGLKNNGTNNETECFEITVNEPKQRKDESRKGVIAGTVVGGFVLLVALYSVYYIKKRKQDNRRRIRRFLDDYKALRPTRYTYSDVKKITDEFKHKLGRGGYGTVYKGMLSTDIPVAVKVLNNIKGNGEEFINEVGTIGKIHHVNVVRLVGYCADGYRRALVYEYLENDSLEKYILSSNQRSVLGWEKLHEIALGIAKGIDYLHQGCNQRILHFDIKPHNILLDHNLNPKVADFGLAKLCSKEQSVVTMTAARGTIGYIAPEVFSRNFGRVSYKSDIYSYGMLLLDMVGGRKRFDARGQDSGEEVYFPEWMYNQLDKGENIEIEVEKEDELDIVKRLIIVGLWCIQWYPIDRPSMKIAIQMLEGESMPMMPPNPFGVDSTSGSSGNSGSGETSMSSGIIQE